MRARLEQEMARCSHRRLVALASAFVLLTSVIPVEASAYVCKFSEGAPYVNLAWHERSIPYGIRDGTPLEPRVVHSAFEAWSELDCTDLEFRYERTVSSDRDDVNQVMFVSSGWADRGKKDPRDTAIVALTVSRSRIETGQMLGSTIEVNEEHFDFADVTALSACEGSMDLISVLTHEVGHVLGLDHTQDENVHDDRTDPTMKSVVESCTAHLRTLEEDDEQGICHLYPLGSPNGYCAPLPAESSSAIKNVPMGCSDVHSPRGGAAIVFLSWILAFSLQASRDTRRRRACRGLPNVVRGGKNRAP